MPKRDRLRYCLERGVNPDHHCCLDMAYAIAHPTETPHQGPNRVMDWIAQWNEYRIPVSYDGYASTVIRHCPWCGTRLPESREKEWYDHLYQLGYHDPGEQEIPEEFKDDRWWREPSRDGLTGLLSRQRLLEDIHSEVSDTSKEKAQFDTTFLCIDIDNLLGLTERLGYQASDGALRSLAKSLVTQFPKDRVYRLGGDEFVVWLIETSPPARPKLSAEMTSPESVQVKWCELSVSVNRDRERASRTTHWILNHLDRATIEARREGAKLDCGPLLRPR